jgi:hypothetical protein
MAVEHVTAWTAADLQSVRRDMFWAIGATSLSFGYCLLFDLLCGLVVRVRGYRTEMYCATCEVRTEFICVM